MHETLRLSTRRRNRPKCRPSGFKRLTLTLVCVRVSELAHNAGFGVRQFERRSGYEIGIPPKLYARIARFEAALRCKATSPEMRGTVLGHAQICRMQ